MPKVRFNLKNDQGLILLKYRYIRGGAPFVYSLNRHCPRKYWDVKTGRCKSTNHFPRHKAINELLQHLENEVINLHDRLLIQGTQPTRKDFKNHLDNILFKTATEKMTLFKFIQVIIDDKKSNAKTNNQNTIESYTQLLKVLRRFDKSLDFNDIGFAWLKKFERWCYSEGYAVSTAAKHVRNTKAVINAARKEGYTDNQAVKERGFNISSPKGNKMVLDLNELEKIEAINWDNVTVFEGMTRERLEKVADVITAGCWSGVRHSDLTKIRRKNIKVYDGVEFIELWTKKSDTPVAIPMLPPLKRVMVKRGYRLPYVSRSEVLTVGRKVLKLAGVNSQVQWRNTQGGGLTITPRYKYDQFSSHVLRRTFATNLYLLGVEVSKIRAITGHSTEKQFLEYVNVGKWMSVKYFKTLQQWRERLGLAA